MQHESRGMFPLLRTRFRSIWASNPVGGSVNTTDPVNPVLNGQWRAARGRPNKEVDGCTSCAAPLLPPPPPPLDSSSQGLPPELLIAAPFADDPGRNLRPRSRTTAALQERSTAIEHSSHPPPRPAPTRALTGADVYRVNTGEQQADSVRVLASLLQLPEGVV